MLHLNREVLSKIRPVKSLTVPTESQLCYPEKVLQFGTGVLLRGLPDHYIYEAARKEKFSGRIVVVKSTPVGSADAFQQQQGLYTLCVKGIQDGKVVDHAFINSSISRVLSADEHWTEIVRVAESPVLEFVVSNTTEVGIVETEENIHTDGAPASFPGKLLALLFHRFNFFNGDPSKGLVIIPTELIDRNGDKLKSLLFALADKNGLCKEFMHWLRDSNPVCNSLVDRIVPGKMSAKLHQEKELELGYRDELMIMAEPFQLWAIESSDPRVAKVLSFADKDAGCFVVADISAFKEIKLRLLNGTHTFSCGVALLAGKELVREAMEDHMLQAFIRRLAADAIAPLVAGNLISMQDALQFASSVMDRFVNPFIDHRWSSISAQFTAKMKMRNLPLIMESAHRYGSVSREMVIGFASFLLCMDTSLDEKGQYWIGHVHTPFLLTDSYAGSFHDMWKAASIAEAVSAIMSSVEIWETDLTRVSGFLEAVTYMCIEIKEKGIESVLRR